MKTPIPETPVSPITTARQWLARYEHCVRQRDYAGAKALFHKRTVCFGIESDLTVDLDAISKQEWEQVWPNQLSFSFDNSKCSIIPEGNLILITIAWTARSVIVGAPPKHGRASIVLLKFKGNRVLCVHFHLSAIAKVAIA